MNIIDSLSRDIGEILQLELCDPRSNKAGIPLLDKDSLSIYLLLLLGHRRNIKAPKTPKIHLEYDADDDGEGLDEGEQTQDKPEGNVVGINAFKALQGKIKSFCYPNPYIKKLLFRDFHQDDGISEYETLPSKNFGTVLIHREAILYVNEVLLLRPLQLARRNGDKPTNLHLLLETLCRFSKAAGAWADTAIARCHEDLTNGSEQWFEDKAKLLQALDNGQGDNISPTAFNRRRLSGPYWLTAGRCSGKVIEELTLLNVLELTPLPLLPSFAGDTVFAELLKGTVDSLNMRYRCLRSAGLPPEEWLQQDKPSIEELRKLARLRKRVSTTEEWGNGDIEAAFSRAFDEELQNVAAKYQGKHQETDKKIVGCSDFNTFKDSAIGDAFIRRTYKNTVSLSELLNEEHGDFDVEAINTNTAEAVEIAFDLETLLQEAGQRLSGCPVLVMFFQEVLIADKGLFGKHGLYQDDKFHELLLADSRYAELAQTVAGLREDLQDPELLEPEMDALQEQLDEFQTQLSASLFFEVRRLIFDVLVARDGGELSPILLAYVREVIIDEQPARGIGGLFNKKSFKKLLDDDVSLSTLPAEKLQEELERQALTMFTKLFNKQL